MRPLGAQSSNTVVAIGERLLLKAYRRVQPGINPEREIGRFLTEIVPFPHSVPIAGAIEYVASDGTPTTLALLQGYIENQGDAWAYTLNYVEQFLEQKRGGTVPYSSRRVCATALASRAVPAMSLEQDLGDVADYVGLGS